jgi:hypothetical protein
MIILFWLGTVGWLGYREVWPWLHPSETPPFVIDLADEVTSQLPNERMRGADVLWRVYRGENEEIGQAETRYRYIKEDHTYELQSRVPRLNLVPGLQIHVRAMETTYRLTERGELLGISAQGTLSVLGFDGNAKFEGEVRGDKLLRQCEVTLPAGLGKIEPHLEPIDAPQGIFLNPLHPVPRVKGLQPGRRWRMPVVDPMADLIGPILEAGKQKLPLGIQMPKVELPAGPKSLDAEVLTETAEITWNSRTHECYIIEYRGENEKLRTYVRKSDGLVLRQESEAFGTRFYMQRY